MTRQRPTFGEIYDRVDAAVDARFFTRPSAMVLAETFLVLGWFRSVVAKVIDARWWSGDLVRDFLADHDELRMPWYDPVADTIFGPYATWWACVVLGLEVFVVTTLVSARRVGLGLGVACVLNANFILMGKTNPSIFYLVLQIMLVLWMLEAADPTVSHPPRTLRAISIGGVLSAVALIPSIATADPRLIKDDPAATLAAWCICVALAAAVARRRLRRRALAIPTIDLTSAATTIERRREASRL